MNIFEITDDSVNKAWSGANSYCFSMKDYSIKNVSELAVADIPDGVSKSQVMVNIGYIPYVSVNDIEIMRAFINTINNKKLKENFDKVTDAEFVDTFWKYSNVYPEISNEYGEFEQIYVINKIVAWCKENGICYEVK